jgi:hypothetical protein
LTENGRLEGTDLERLEVEAGPAYAKAYYNSVRTKFVTTAMTDDDGIKLVNAVKAHQNGDITWDAALSRVGKVKSPASYMAVYLIGRQAKEFAQGNGEFASYNTWLKGKTQKIDSRTADLVSTIDDYINAMTQFDEGARGAFVEKSFKSYSSWLDKNPDATEEEYLEWRSEQFGKQSKEIVQWINAPQAQQTGLGVGAIEDGYEYLGGDPSQESSWRAL